MTATIPRTALGTSSVGGMVASVLTVSKALLLVRTVAMPSKDQSTRHGLKSKYLSPYSARILLGVMSQRSANAVARELGITRGGVTMLIRIAEKKLGVRLFDRETGRAHSDWTPRLTPDTESAWAKIRGVSNGT